MLTDPSLRLVVKVDLLLVIMMMTAGNYTSLQRFRRRSYATPEDFQARGVPLAGPDEQVERARRLHANHVENVLPFFVVSYAYALTQPAYSTLALCMWGFLAARVLYSVCYAAALQPYRTIFFTLGALLMFGMAVSGLLAVV